MWLCSGVANPQLAPVLGCTNGELRTGVWVVCRGTAPIGGSVESIRHTHSESPFGSTDLVVAVGSGAPSGTDSGLRSLGCSAVPMNSVDSHRAVAAVTASFAEVLTLPKVAWVHTPNAGVDSLLSSGHWPSGVALTRTVGGMPRRIGRYVLAVDLAERIRLREYADQQRSSIWSKLAYREFSGARAAVFGTGHMGSGVARALTLNGYEVIGVNRTGRPQPAIGATVSWDSLGAIRHADLLVDCLPLTRETQCVLDESVFRHVRSAHLVNVGRAATVDVESALRALDMGNLSAITTDVLTVEPPAPTDPLWAHPRVTVTPHIAGPTLLADVLEAFQASRKALSVGARPGLLVDSALGY